MKVMKDFDLTSEGKEKFAKRYRRVYWCDCSFCIPRLMDAISRRINKKIKELKNAEAE